MSHAAELFHERARQKTIDLTHRQTIRWAIDTYDRSVARGKTRFLDWEAARQRCHEIKREAIEHLDLYLEQFEANVMRRGGKVFWARDAAQARDYVAGLAAARRVEAVVKSKSMATEEIHLNQALQAQGIRVWETDLGEFIVQLRNEPPYHIVTPAMHLSRADIAALFKEKIPHDMLGDSHEELVAAARRALRRAFFSAQMGISGANFLVADAGMVALTSNEGNARLCTTLPAIHVVIAGIEKVIARLEDLAVLWPVLATSGTGQKLTTYNSLIGGPRTVDENDGPREFHVVLLDNGRSRVLAEARGRELLHCIRCGACLNACPVYRNIGGHTYATTYQGPIGSSLVPNLAGFEQHQHLAYASSLCGNCTSVCPVKIDLAQHLLLNRKKAVERGHAPWQERVAVRLWRWTMMGPGRFQWAGRIARLLFKMLGGERTKMLKPWTEARELPNMPTLSFRQLWRQRGLH